MKDEYILIGVLGIAVIALVLAFSGTSVNASGKNTATNFQDTEAGSKDSNMLKSISTGSTGSGDVSIELTPYKPSNGKLVVDISANTHSVDLDQFDLKEITTLEYGGKMLKPSSAPRLNGHHSGGTFEFDIGEDIAGFSITIGGIPKVEERVFEWP